MRIMRNIDEVIDQVLTQIPTEEVALRASLQRVKSDARYRAPEQLLLSWERGQTVFEHESKERWNGDESQWPQWFKNALLVWSRRAQ